MNASKRLLAAGICLLIVCISTEAEPHSTKGRIKIPLEKAVLEIDDVAYFFESYVHRQLYRDRYEQSRRRFYVKEFLRIDQDGPRATVHFLTLDVKEKRDFPDRMHIRRGSDGVWTWTPAEGESPVALYTYVRKWGYYYQKIILPVSAVGLVLTAVFWVWLRFKRHQAVAVGNLKKGDNSDG